MQHSLGQLCLTVAALFFSSGQTRKGKRKVGSHSIRAQGSGDLGWRTQQRPRTAEAKVLVSNSPKLPAKPTLQTGEAVTMTDFAVQRRRQRQRRMGGCCMRKTGRERGRRKVSSLCGTQQTMTFLGNIPHGSWNPLSYLLKLTTNTALKKKKKKEKQSEDMMWESLMLKFLESWNLLSCGWEVFLHLAHHAWKW